MYIHIYRSMESDSDSDTSSVMNKINKSIKKGKDEKILSRRGSSKEKIEDSLPLIEENVVDMVLDPEEGHSSKDFFFFRFHSNKRYTQ
jgi:hypothetical protein